MTENTHYKNKHVCLTHTHTPLSNTCVCVCLYCTLLDIVFSLKGPTMPKMKKKKILETEGNSFSVSIYSMFPNPAASPSLFFLEHSIPLCALNPIIQQCDLPSAHLASIAEMELPLI